MRFMEMKIYSAIRGFRLPTGGIQRILWYLETTRALDVKRDIFAHGNARTTDRAERDRAMCVAVRRGGVQPGGGPNCPATAGKGAFLKEVVQ